MINEEARQLGDYIKKLRKNKKVTAKELGSYVGYSQSYISAIENNNNNNVPSKKVLNRLATALRHIGYDHADVEEKLYSIAGYPSRRHIAHDDDFKISYSKYLGAYDNLSNVPLEKPYLDLFYVLDNKFDLKFQYKNNGFDEYVELNDKHKSFIKNMITQLLFMEDIEENIKIGYEKALEEQAKINHIEVYYDEIAQKLDRLRNDLRVLNDLRKNFSEENFKYEYDNTLQVLSMELEEHEEELDFSKETLLNAIEFISSEIARLTDEYDKETDKED
ncbi:helix-turn-helix transcriptional regulator [Macrococcus equipercicus]|uniref:Helix-turn-helix transcriptional regulator n=1 Tax=Macrococcus equipercicus TaxID=69967 RepID=A0ABQ6R8M3_9STAP|nr:helix-turn-helix transcriptional regulator [Macrococcus equipercicus]KAA1039489.1 helix-turn-helix transcriptional regulator [Macrococcus equipercicus]